MLLAGLMPEYIAPVLTVICFAIVLKEKIKSGEKLRLNRLSVSIAAFWGWMLIGCFWSSSVISSLASMGLWLLMICGFYAFSEALPDEACVDSVIKGGSYTAGIAGFIGIIQMVIFHFGNYFFDGLSKVFNPFWRCLDLLIEKLVVILPEFILAKMPSTTFHTFETRACGTFSNPIFFASIEVMLIPFCAYFFLCGKEKKERIAGLICLMLSVGGIACSYSRGPYLAAAIVFLILLLYGGKKAAKLCAVGVVCGGAVMAAASGTVKRMLTLLSGNDVSVNTRKDIWAAIAESIAKKPVLGYGTGFNNIREILHNQYNIMQPHAHNILLEVWAENGIIGAAFFAAIFIIFFINIVKLYNQKGKQRDYAVTLFASMAGFVLCGMTDCLFYGLKPLQYMLMVFGLSQAVFTIFLNKTEVKK